MRRLIPLLLLLVGFPRPCIAEDKPLTVDQVIALASAGVADDDIISRIKSSGAKYTLGVDDVLRLTEGGVSAKVIRAMRETVEPPAGAGDPKEGAQGTPTGKRDLLLIIDCSGSMLGRTRDGEVKLEAAKRVLLGLIERLPDDLNVGLLAYGHRLDGNHPETCQDIELVVPVVAADKARLAAAVKGFQGRGRTPISSSLTRAGEILSGPGREREKALVLVTDGIETCGGDPRAAAQALLGLGIKIEFVVIGFDLTESEAQATRAIAEGGKGKYLDAKNAHDLEEAFEEVHRALVVRAPEVGRGEIVSKSGPGFLDFAGQDQPGVPKCGILVSTRTDEVIELARGEDKGLQIGEFWGLGARVLGVGQDSAAARAGLRRGDLVVRADDSAVMTVKQLQDFFAAPPTHEDAGKPWRLRVARFKLACPGAATWVNIPKLELPAGDYFLIASGSKGGSDVGTDTLGDQTALAAGGSYVVPLRWGLRLEPKTTVEIALPVGFRFIRSESEGKLEDVVRIVDTRLGVEVHRFTIWDMGMDAWAGKSPVVPVPAGHYTLEWARQGSDAWIEITKDFEFDGKSLIDVKF